MMGISQFIQTLSYLTSMLDKTTAGDLALDSVLGKSKILNIIHVCTEVFR